MKIKVILGIMVVVVMALFSMTACGNSDVVEQPTEQPAETVVETEAEGAAQEETPPASKPEVQANDPSDIGEEKAKQIVLAKVPGAVEASIYEFERDIDDGRVEYEGSLYHDGYEYEFEVDGATGNILKWEIDD